MAKGHNLLVSVSSVYKQYLENRGENINICWSPDGQTIAVGNKDDVVTFIDAKTHRSKAEEQFKFEVNEISWNNDNNMFFLTNGNGCINILRTVKSFLDVFRSFWMLC
ncbi:Tho Complex Subunit 3 [Manis pentadactyla]|nr:Tho Complex Subunit 3 [Manis pentadactyla]